MENAKCVVAQLQITCILNWRISKNNRRPRNINFWHQKSQIWKIIKVVKRLKIRWTLTKRRLRTWNRR